MARVIAIGAVSPLGVGAAAYAIDAIGAPAATSITRDAELEAIGLRKPFAARAKPSQPSTSHDDPATRLLHDALSQILDRVPRDARLGVSVGTSSGAMSTSQRLFDARADATTNAAEIEQLARGATYSAPFAALCATLLARGHRLTKTTHPLAACAASTIAIGLAMRWLDEGVCDLVIAGGYDALTPFVAAGFEALGATSKQCPPRPLRRERDGMSLSEGAALFLLARDDAAAEPIASIVGFGAAGDAVHLTAPDRNGGGLARAIERAVADAQIDALTIGLVSLHGTATQFSDAMEGHALRRTLGDRAETTPVCASKASIGHTLGAAGVLETALLIDAIARDRTPPTPGEGDLDPDVGLSPRTAVESSRVAVGLKLSAAFGGANAALIVTRAPRASRVATPRVTEEAASTPWVEDSGAELDLSSIAVRSGVARDRLARMDRSCVLALDAVASLAVTVGRGNLQGAGIVLGSFIATIDLNAIYADGIRRRGAAHAEGRRFAYTTPIAAVGECSVAFSLTGPNIVVGRGADAGIEADEVAQTLLRAGDADRVVVVEVDARGPFGELIFVATGVDRRFGARARLLVATASR